MLIPEGTRWRNTSTVGPSVVTVAYGDCFLDKHASAIDYETPDVVARWWATPDPDPEVGPALIGQDRAGFLAQFEALDPLPEPSEAAYRAEARRMVTVRESFAEAGVVQLVNGELRPSVSGRGMFAPALIFIDREKLQLMLYEKARKAWEDGDDRPAYALYCVGCVCACCASGFCDEVSDECTCPDADRLATDEARP